MEAKHPVEAVEGLATTTIIPLVPKALHSQEISTEAVAKDEEAVQLVASLKYVRVNYVHFRAPELCVYESLSPILSGF